MRPGYRSMAVRAELGESMKGKNIVEETAAIARDLAVHGISPTDAAGYVNETFLDLLAEFLSGGIVIRTVREIGSSPEYYASPERAQSDQGETTFTLTKKLSVDVGEIYPYVEVSFRAGPLELKTARFTFRLSGRVTVQNPRVTVYRGKILRAAIGTVTPSFSVYFTGGGKDRLIHTFEKPLAFSEIDLTPPAPESGGSI